MFTMKITILFQTLVVVICLTGVYGTTPAQEADASQAMFVTSLNHRGRLQELEKKDPTELNDQSELDDPNTKTDSSASDDSSMLDNQISFDDASDFDDLGAFDDQSDLDDPLYDSDYQGIEDPASNREGKLFFSMMRVMPSPCDASMNNISVTGVCLTRVECELRQGTVHSACGAGNIAVCCILSKSCDLTTNNNHTFFTNPDYPEFDAGMGACSFSVNRMNRQNICQIRVDFLELELSQPDDDGMCMEDFLTITGGSSPAPTICGNNTGQHLYVDIDPTGSAVKIIVDRASTAAEGRIWNIKVSQIACNSRFKAPDDCLQFYTATSGIVQSFNFGPTMDETGVLQTTRQISQMQYTICVQRGSGYCSIMWSMDPNGSEFDFTMSHSVDGMDPSLVGTPVASTTGVNCTSDSIIIAGGIDDAGNRNNEYCGGGFPKTVTSSMRPFKIYVRHNGDEKGDMYNRGFRLHYRQLMCT